MDGQPSHPNRPCRFAGSFFPAETEILKAEVGRFLQQARALGHSDAATPQAILAPHAGYRFSGALAGIAYAAVSTTPARITVLSPSHRHAFAGIAVPSQPGFDTPLGPVPIDRASCDALIGRGLVQELDAAHDNEHGIETQLPFIRTLWPGVRVLPLVIGAAEPAQVAAVLETLPDDGHLVVISSDLSHFLNHPAAQAKDAETAALIETGAWQKLTGHHACGARGLQGWMGSRPGQATKPLRLGMGDSVPASGDPSRVVGYGAWGFYPIDTAMLAAPWQTTLLDTARRALAFRLSQGRAPQVATDSFAAPLQTWAASFVTLTHHGRLRGCIGSLAPQQPLILDAVTNAQKAALNDHRFAPVSADLLPELKLKIAVLSRATKMTITSEANALEQIVPGQDGLILSAANRRGTFLPMVWESLPEPQNFLRQLKRKAGLPEDFWADDVSLHRFRAESFAEAG